MCTPRNPKEPTLARKTIMNRLGLHYFPDTAHYRQHDSDIWLPRLQSLGASWLVLNAPTNRAIPEHFIRALLAAQIQPLLHFQISPQQLPAAADLQLLFDTYQRWGVRYAALFDQPNTHQVWQAAAWAQDDLVERFLDLYLPLANASLKAGLTPVFPPLKPGGDYWDTAFLRRALESLGRRGQHDLLAQLVLGAYGSPGQHPLQWGAGGPARWPQTRPYYTPPESEDQRGFRIFDWYAAISQAVCADTLPIFLFGLGYTATRGDHVNQNLRIVGLLADEGCADQERVPREVLGGAFAPLTDAHNGAVQGWFRQDGTARAQAMATRQWVAQRIGTSTPAPSPAASIRHYLLLPSYEWGISDYHLDIIRPLIKKYQPTIGFSFAEAQHAARVTVIGGEGVFRETALNQLRAAGILVQRIDEDGTDIASVLATR